MLHTLIFARIGGDDLTRVLRGQVLRNPSLRKDDGYHVYHNQHIEKNLDRLRNLLIFIIFLNSPC